MGQRTKPRIIGAGGSILSGLWATYANWTTASQLPTDAGWWAKMLAEPPVYLPWLALAIFVFWAAHAFWPRDEEPQPTEAASQTSQGHGSPNISGVGGDVSIHYGDHSDSHRTRTPAQLRGDYKLAAQHRCPPMNIAEALRHLCALGNTAEQARIMLQQAFSDGSLEVWGRPQIPVRTFQQPQEPKETWHHINKSYWDDFKLSEGAFDLEEVGPQTVHQAHLMKGLLRKYWNLRVSEDELKYDWPELLKPQSVPRGPSGPGSWMR